LIWTATEEASFNWGIHVGYVAVKIAKGVVAEREADVGVNTTLRALGVMVRPLGGRYVVVSTTGPEAMFTKPVGKAVGLA
jgi:hypothetical protein